MPGGVSSPIRAMDPFPFYAKSTNGSKIYDVDGNEYIDYCLGYGPQILGHNNSFIKQAILNQLEDGWIFGVPYELEIKLAEIISDAYNAIEMLRFVSTGTEATMSAIRLARGYTKKNKIIKIEGGFHGSHDSVLVKAGSGLASQLESSSAGIPADFIKHTLQVPFNDVESLVKTIGEHKDDIAAMIIEPVMGNIGPVVPDEGYLRDVRKITEEHGILLIFDEVITGFRLAMGGASEYFNIDPDLVTLGKIVGGGLPIGVFGGKNEIMAMVSPSGPVYQAGTFSGSPCTLSAGIAMLDFLKKENVHEKLNSTGDLLRSALSDIIADKKLDYSVSGLSSMFKIFFGEFPHNYSDVLKCDKGEYLKFFHRMMNEGIFLPPTQFETNFISFAHSEEDLEKTIEGYQNAL
jgi:glutamate-1-semialdehyde 2,1-aminomutase